jgi:DNA-binding MarR family transcriptional regulator
VRAGLVSREPCPDDARGTFTVLTQAGYERLRDAAGIHLAGVRRQMMRLVRPDELAVFGAVLRRVANAHGVPHGPPD